MATICASHSSIFCRTHSLTLSPALLTASSLPLITTTCTHRHIIIKSVAQPLDKPRPLGARLQGFAS